MTHTFMYSWYTYGGILQPRGGKETKRQSMPQRLVASFGTGGGRSQSPVKYLCVVYIANHCTETCLYVYEGSVP